MLEIILILNLAILYCIIKYSVLKDKVNYVYRCTLLYSINIKNCDSWDKENPDYATHICGNSIVTLEKTIFLPFPPMEGLIIKYPKRDLLREISYVIKCVMWSERELILDDSGDKEDIYRKLIKIEKNTFQCQLEPIEFDNNKFNFEQIYKATIEHILKYVDDGWKIDWLCNKEKMMKSIKEKA